ncbi:MAG TPA: uroporphyrinogen-III synthase [Hyphomonadaceae bacterium]|jgi:uroporphyrinogen-III synthase|nr:uroporphyrinogen-III synthase [Hyphomonadaceae bacterium]
MTRVLVTRSEPGASETAQRLVGLGFEPIVEPVFEIEPIDGVALPAFGALAFTSANGVRAFARLSPRRDVPVFCVGARTADEARAVGFANVTSADGDVSALGLLVGEALPPGARLLHSGNDDSRGDLAGQLGSQGIAAAFVATFRAAPVKSPGPMLAAHLKGSASFDAVLIHSPRAAKILSGFLRPDSATFGNPAAMNVAAISEAAAEPLRQIARRVEIASTPNEEALLKALSVLCDLG